MYTYKTAGGTEYILRGCNCLHPICCIQSVLEYSDSMSWGRYVSLWSSIAPLRVETEWWDSTLLPLKQLEATATSGPAVTALPSVLKFASDEKSEPNEIGQQGGSGTHPTISQESSGTELRNTVSNHATTEVTHTLSGNIQPFNPRSVREDLEMDTKLYTEPLPTNQQVSH